MMEQSGSLTTLPDQLIFAGMEELVRYGVHNFSLRRVAGACGVSCAAPYKHFQDKQRFIDAIIGYIDDKWSERRRAAAHSSPASTQALILRISVEYIRFLMDNRNFIPILLMRNEHLGQRHSALRGQLSRETYALVDRYCEEMKISPEARQKKTYVIRSLIYGAVLMFDNGELPYTPDHLAMVQERINREFGLP